MTTDEWSETVLETETDGTQQKSPEKSTHVPAETGGVGAGHWETRSDRRWPNDFLPPDVHIHTHL